MALRYVRVFPSFDYYPPAVRPTGNLVVIGAATASSVNVPVQVTSPDEARAKFSAPNAAASPLTTSLITAMRQSPTATQFWGIRQDTDITKSLVAAEALNVQFVVLAATPLTADSGRAGGAIAALRDHVVTVSDRVDGKERMGVAMLSKDVADAALVTGVLAHDRMVYVAHRSDDDAAAAVAGTIAGYPPYTSMVLKQVAIVSPPFTSAQIDTLNGSEDESNPVPPGIAGNGVIWLTSPTLIPGGGVYLGEGYTGNSRGLKFIDVQRTIDDVTFRLKARMIGAIGNLRISRSGLRALVVQMEAVLNPLVEAGVLEGFTVTVPVLNLLDADPATLTPAQVQAVRDAHSRRIAQVLVGVEYAGAMHRININLKFN
ncbi:hypothetical protein [Nocardia transvalensis]|uniref:hypothetical protein n=1 Tax=Nocardia transvalensis TaxID=37333 RepID=UPI0018963965|nr:hypothetical protein [Nocardia transvalensis]MBF6328329.1 hypothetical protein [Nocardia transvalensis]